VTSEAGLQIASIQDRYLFSLSQLSSAFGPSRETVTKRLRAAEIAPRGKRQGYDVYHIGDAAAAILADSTPEYDGQADPDLLPPKERLDWFKSENERFKVEVTKELLISTDAVTVEWAKILREVGLALDSIIDKLEQKAGLTSAQLVIVEAIIDSIRLALAIKLEGNNV